MKRNPFLMKSGLFAWHINRFNLLRYHILNVTIIYAYLAKTEDDQ